MPVMYDAGTGGFLVESGHCEYCGEPMYETGCDAPGCKGYQCLECGAGCDVEIDPEGRCATALAEESDEEYTERVNAERAAFGLSPLPPADQEAAVKAAGQQEDQTVSAPDFTVDAVRAALIRRGFTEYDEDADVLGFRVYKSAMGPPQVLVEVRGINTLPFNPGQGPRALIGGYLEALQADGYNVRSTGREVIVSA